MKKILLFYFIIFLFINMNINVFGQSDNNNLPKFYIKFLNLNDNIQKQNLTQKIQSLSFISEFDVNFDNCYITFDKEYNSKQIAGLLQKASLNYDILNFETVNKELLKSSDNYFFPKYINTGNEKLDEQNYENAKNAWIESHPKEFEKIKHLDLDKLSGRE